MVISIQGLIKVGALVRMSIGARVRMADNGKVRFGDNRNLLSNGRRQR